MMMFSIFDEFKFGLFIGFVVVGELIGPFPHMDIRAGIDGIDVLHVG